MVSATTEPGLDRGDVADDHIPVLAHLQWALQGKAEAGEPTPNQDNFKDHQALASFKNKLKQLPPVSWEVEVNQLTSEAVGNANQAALSALGKQKRKPRQSYMEKTRRRSSKRGG